MVRLALNETEIILLGPNITVTVVSEEGELVHLAVDADALANTKDSKNLFHPLN